MTPTVHRFKRSPSGTRRHQDACPRHQRDLPRSVRRAGGRRADGGGRRGGALLPPQARQAAGPVLRLGAPGAGGAVVPGAGGLDGAGARRGRLLLRPRAAGARPRGSRARRPVGGAADTYAQRAPRLPGHGAAGARPGGCGSSPTTSRTPRRPGWPRRTLDARVLVLDGRGERRQPPRGATGPARSCACSARQELPHSLGLLYEELTEHLGFLRSRDEYKVMALASYGEPALPRRAARAGPRRPATAGSAATRRLAGAGQAPGTPARSDRGPRRPRRQRAAPARGGAARPGRLAARARPASRALTLAGGVALNCVANTGCSSEGPFERVWVQPAAGDAGTALGGALHVARGRGRPCRADARRRPRPRLERRRARGVAADRAACPYERPDDVAEAAAECLAGDGIVAWFQGRSEYGPRALGHRSLLAHPGDGATSSGSTTSRAASSSGRSRRWCWPSGRRRSSRGARCPSPYMLFVHDVRREWRERIPAVVHVDGTARVQTVDADARAARARGCSTAFERRTGLPVVVNTVLNTAGRPMVDDPRDALECFGSAPGRPAGARAVRRPRRARSRPSDGAPDAPRRVDRRPDPRPAVPARLPRRAGRAGRPGRGPVRRGGRPAGRTGTPPTRWTLPRSGRPRTRRALRWRRPGARPATPAGARARRRGSPSSTTTCVVRRRTGATGSPRTWPRPGPTVGGSPGPAPGPAARAPAARPTGSATTAGLEHGDAGSPPTWPTAAARWRRVGGFDERLPAGFPGGRRPRAARAAGRVRIVTRPARACSTPCGPPTLGQRAPQARQRRRRADARLHGPRLARAAGAPRGRRRRHVAVTAAAGVVAVALLATGPGRRRRGRRPGVARGDRGARLGPDRARPARPRPRSDGCSLTSAAIPPVATDLARRVRGAGRCHRLRRRPAGAACPSRCCSTATARSCTTSPTTATRRLVAPVPGRPRRWTGCGRPASASAWSCEPERRRPRAAHAASRSTRSTRGSRSCSGRSTLVCLPARPATTAATAASRRPAWCKRAARALGVDPAECVIVGDIGADVGAAAAAGAARCSCPTPATRAEEVDRARRGRLAATSRGGRPSCCGATRREPRRRSLPGGPARQRRRRAARRAGRARRGGRRRASPCWSARGGAAAAGCCPASTTSSCWRCPWIVADPRPSTRRRRPARRRRSAGRRSTGRWCSRRSTRPAAHRAGAAAGRRPAGSARSARTTRARCSTCATAAADDAATRPSARSRLAGRRLRAAAGRRRRRCACARPLPDAPAALAGRAVRRRAPRRVGPRPRLAAPSATPQLRRRCSPRPGRRVVVTGGPGERALTAAVAGGHRRRPRPRRRAPTWPSSPPCWPAPTPWSSATPARPTSPPRSAPPSSRCSRPTVPAARWRAVGVPHVLLGDQDAACARTPRTRCPVARPPVPGRASTAARRSSQRSAPGRPPVPGPADRQEVPA